jgi:hypothetical protein
LRKPLLAPFKKESQMATDLRSKAWLYVGVAVVALVIGLFAIACGDDGSSGPEQTVQEVMAAMETKDIDRFWAVLDPKFYEEFVAMGMTEEQLKSTLAEEMYGDSATIKFSDVKLETQISDDGQTAVVTVVEGTVTKVENGQTTTEDVKDSDEPQVFNLVLRDGKWYWDITSIM